MKYLVFLVVLAMLLGMAAVAFADTVTLTDNTANGSSTTAIDSYIRAIDQPDVNFGDPFSGAGGTLADFRWLPDSGYPSGKSPRHDLVWFDVSSIAPGATITSATFGIYLQRSSSSAPTITGFQLSRLQPGSTWVEGTGNGTGTGPANAGEPTWNSRGQGSTLWATAGATGAADIDLTTTKTYGDVTAAQGNAYRTMDVTNWVQGWVSGAYANTGMLMYGGTGPGGANNYWTLGCFEDAAQYRPYLTITYTPAPVPEPSSLLALAGFGIAGLGFMRRRRA